MTISDSPGLPPMLQPRQAGEDEDPFDLACQLAAAEADPGLACYADCDRLGFAVVLGPEMASGVAAQMLHVMTIALYDTVGSLGPAGVMALIRWPARLLVNGAEAGAVRLAMGRYGVGGWLRAGDEHIIPDWLVVGAEITRMRQSGNIEPGHRRESTNIDEEGFADIDSGSFIASLARYFLSWLRTWEEDGFAPIARAWVGRTGESDISAPSLGKDGSIIMSGGRRETILQALAAQ